MTLWRIACRDPTTYDLFAAKKKGRPQGTAEAIQHYSKLTVLHNDAQQSEQRDERLKSIF